MLPVLYRDEHLIAINKPSGLLVHRSEIDRHETRFALQLVRDQIGQHVYPFHRLDKPTSGVLTFALDQDTARKMTALFSTGEVKKTYLAIVRGYTATDGHIDYPLKHMLDPIADKKAKQDKPEQAAITNYARQATIELPYYVDRYPTSRYSLLKLAPKTGRKHQLRRHMKHISHPIVGDTTHGKSKHNHFFAQQFGVKRLLLHATAITFKHPHTQTPCSIQAPIDADFSRLLEKFNWQGNA